MGSFTAPASCFLTSISWNTGFSGEILGSDHLNHVRGLPCCWAFPWACSSDRIGRKRDAARNDLYVVGAAIEVTVPTADEVWGAAFVSGAGQSLFYLSQAPFMMKVSNAQNRTLLFSLNFGLITLAGAAREYVCRAASGDVWEPAGLWRPKRPGISGCLAHFGGCQYADINSAGADQRTAISSGESGIVTRQPANLAGTDPTRNAQAGTSKPVDRLWGSQPDPLHECIF